ncbi:MAG: hypothetical protein R3Y21_03030 [Mycoplasmatota bacterium]
MLEMIKNKAIIGCMLFLILIMVTNSYLLKIEQERISNNEYVSQS